MPDNISRKIMQRGWRRQGRRARLGLVGGLCTGLILCIFSFWGGREIFMARPLSMNHAGQEKICGNCHHPFEGVSDHRCATTCHTEIYNWSLPVNLRAKEPGIPYKQGIHYYSGNFDKQKNCLKCHPAKCHPRDLKKTKPPEDTDSTVQCEARDVENLRIPEPLSENSCINCHKNCERSTRCFDCHNEHVDGMPITVNDPDDKFQGLTIVLKEDFLPGTIPEEIEWAEVKPAPQEYSLPRGKFLEMDWTGDEKIMATFERFRGRMHENNCMGCHPDILYRKEPTPDEIDKSKVARSIFRHDGPGHRNYFKCKACHITKFPHRRDREENIFTMEACAKKCHYRDDCAGCHRFHEPIHKPGERVDWPYRLIEYNRLTGEATDQDEFYAMEKSPAATEEMEPSTQEPASTLEY